MNKAAAKEPSMDEILSSIRQIIADDDVEAGQAKKNEDGAADAKKADEDLTEQADNIESVADTNSANPSSDNGAEEALELSAEQIVPDESENIDFSPADQNESLAKSDDDKEIEDNKGDEEDMELVVPDDVSFDENIGQQEAEAEESAREEPAPAPSLPDENLADDIADSLIEPATAAAVSSAFSQLGNLGLGDKDLTLEKMVREMLRPMLKEWLNENLPSIVERTVRREVERLSRGE